MNGIKQFLINLMYLCFGLTILAVLYFSYLFSTNVSGSDMNVFIEEQKVNFAEFLEKTKVYASNTKENLGELSEQIAVATVYYVGKLEHSTANIHKDIIKNHKIVELLKNPPPIIIDETAPENAYKFTSDVFLSTKGENRLVYYNQTIEPWRSMEYGPNNTIGKYGCGPTAMSMVLSTFLQENITPEMSAKWAYENNYFAHNSGSYHSLIPEMAEAFGLVSKSLKMPTLDDLSYEIDQGSLIVVLLGKGTFASAGHFVVLRDRDTETGEIYMADSQSIKISQQAWDGNLILNEAKYYANSGGPFWSISLPKDVGEILEETEEDEMFVEGVVERLGLEELEEVQINEQDLSYETENIFDAVTETNTIIEEIIEEDIEENIGTDDFNELDNAINLINSMEMQPIQ